MRAIGNIAAKRASIAVTVAGCIFLSIGTEATMGTPLPITFNSSCETICANADDNTVSLVDPSLIKWERFQTLAKEWRAARNASSSTKVITTHPAYQQIMAMGPDAIPFILAELQQKTDHWFWALSMIAKSMPNYENPVHPSIRGKMSAMAAAWVEWGRANEYID